MRFLADENIPVWTIGKLCEIGHDIIPLINIATRGIPDAIVLDIAIREQRILLTSDADFCNTLLYPPEKHYGIIVFRLHQPNGYKFFNRLIDVLEKLSYCDLKHRVLIIRDNTASFRE